MKLLSAITKESIAGPGSASEANYISPHQSDKSLRIVHQEGISSRIHRENALHFEALGKVTLAWPKPSVPASSTHRPVQLQTRKE